MQRAVSSPGNPVRARVCVSSPGCGVQHARSGAPAPAPAHIMRSAALLLLAAQWLWTAALAAATSHDSESLPAAETDAVIEVVQYRHSRDGMVANNSTLRLQGHFAGAGMRVAAEGKLLQVNKRRHFVAENVVQVTEAQRKNRG